MGPSSQHVKDTCCRPHVEVISRLGAWLASACMPDSSTSGCSTEGIRREEESPNSELPNEMTSLGRLHWAHGQQDISEKPGLEM